MWVPCRRGNRRPRSRARIGACRRRCSRRNRHRRRDGCRGRRATLLRRRHGLVAISRILVIGNKAGGDLLTVGAAGGRRRLLRHSAEIGVALALRCLRCLTLGWLLRWLTLGRLTLGGLARLRRGAGGGTRHGLWR